MKHCQMAVVKLLMLGIYHSMTSLEDLQWAIMHIPYYYNSIGHFLNNCWTSLTVLLCIGYCIVGVWMSPCSVQP